ncbi:MAG: hypothetical protein NT106_09395 [Candidatus Sumerlaeota bacterium]|nr:hypothetical protein [Candidatus Sumerlaeota bacterium]
MEIRAAERLGHLPVYLFDKLLLTFGCGLDSFFLKVLVSDVEAFSL